MSSWCYIWQLISYLTVDVLPVDSCSRCWRSPGDSSSPPVQTWPSAGWLRGGSTDCAASLATLGVTTVWVCQAQTRRTTESCCPSSPVKVNHERSRSDLKLIIRILLYFIIFYLTPNFHWFYFWLNLIHKINCLLKLETCLATLKIGPFPTIS